MFHSLFYLSFHSFVQQTGTHLKQNCPQNTLSLTRYLREKKMKKKPSHSWKCVHCLSSLRFFFTFQHQQRFYAKDIETQWPRTIMKTFPSHSNHMPSPCFSISIPAIFFNFAVPFTFHIKIHYYHSWTQGGKGVSSI